MKFGGTKTTVHLIKGKKWSKKHIACEHKFFADINCDLLSAAHFFHTTHAGLSAQTRPPQIKKMIKMRVRTYKPKRIFLETLEGYIEANRVIKTMEKWN
jgi:hypothetical protein